MNQIENWKYFVWFFLNNGFLYYNWNHYLSITLYCFCFVRIFFILLWCDISLVWASYTWQHRIIILCVILKIFDLKEVLVFGIISDYFVLITMFLVLCIFFVLLFFSNIFSSTLPCLRPRNWPYFWYLPWPWHFLWPEPC